VTQPATTPPATGSAATGQIVSQQEADQWRGSKLVGLDVYGTDNEKIGDINEVLVDRQGNVDAVVIGVGGFLGIGEKNVAIPFKSLQFVDTPRTASRGTDAPARTADAPARPTDPSATASTTAGAPASNRPATTATTGSMGSAGTTAATDRPATSGTADRGFPDHAMVQMSRADLQNAPTFRYLGDRRSDDARTGAGSPSTAPRQ
jgi:sporulation protein YlmC with PRC-barrel domain